MIRLIIYFVFISLIVIEGCIVVKHQDTDETPPQVINLSPKPEIEMSEELIRSKPGDMIAFLPKGWFLVDASDKTSSDIFAVAVNPDYTLSAVFSSVRVGEEMQGAIDKEGLLNLARYCFTKHERKTAGAVKLSGKFTYMQFGAKLFAGYEFSNSMGAAGVKAVVYKSSLGNYYEFALIPMNIKGKPLPATSEIEIIFRSIIATIDY